MFVMVVSFLLEVMFVILTSFVGEVTTLVAPLLLPITDGERAAQQEVAQLKEEQAQLSMVDQFARYSKLQRQIDKLLIAFREKGTERKQRIYYLRMGITGGIYVVHGALLLLLLYLYRATPILNLDRSWMFPLDNVLAFPTGESGSVGLGCWLFVSNAVIHRIKGLVAP